MDRVLIVDDHAAFRRAAEALLGAAGYDVVGTAEDVAHARAAVANLRPDVVLLDVHLPDGDGIDLAAELAALPRPPAVVLVSSRVASDFGPRLHAAPARGFLAKNELSAVRLAAMLAPS